MSASPLLLVYLENPESGIVSWKAQGVKGARWKRARSIYEASHQADDVLPEASIAAPRTIEYVGRKS